MIDATGNEWRPRGYESVDTFPPVDGMAIPSRAEFYREQVRKEQMANLERVLRRLEAQQQAQRSRELSTISSFLDLLKVFVSSSSRACGYPGPGHTPGVGRGQHLLVDVL